MTGNKIKPKEITKDIDTGLETASFGYYDGIQYCKENNIQQSKTTRWSKSEFIVCCGDVMLEVESTQFPEIERRVF